MKIALVLNDDFSMWHFRKGLIKALTDREHSVYVITPSGPYVQKITGLGAKHIAINIQRFTSPLQDIALLFNLYRLFRREKFDIVHTMTIKPNIYGTIAAKMAGVPTVVGLVSGLGLMFSENLNFWLTISKFFVYNMYRFACHLSDRVWFQNVDDMEFFIKNKIIARDKAILIKSGGINLEEYSTKSVSQERMEQLYAELELSNFNVTVTMVTARMVWAKGIREFVEAAEKLQNKYPQVKFIIAGPIEKESPDAVPPEYLENKQSPYLKVIVSFRTDIKEIMALSDIVTLPSYYKEGVPRVLLEALAMGKPVVTTDSPGCREVVEPGINGYLVPVKDSQSLANALEKLIVDEKTRKQFGVNSRLKAENEFNEKTVVQDVIQKLYRIETNNA